MQLGTIEDRNGMDLTEADNIKRWQEYREKKKINTQKNYKTTHKKILMTWIIHLDPDILECEVKWALGSITMNKANEGDVMEFQLSNFKS